MKIIARMRTDFDEKFGIPRQGALAPETMGSIVFEPEFRDVNALKGLDGYSHIWIIWCFSDNKNESRSLTVRPPRLGGNERVGVWATRSPYRPNPIGLTCVKIEKIEMTSEGPVINVSGIDMLNGTPIYDIKPYVPHADCIPQAIGGFAGQYTEYRLEVVCDDELLNRLPKDRRDSLIRVLSMDPRPGYQNDDREYGLKYAGFNVKFQVINNQVVVNDIYNC